MTASRANLWKLKTIVTAVLAAALLGGGAPPTRAAQPSARNGGFVQPSPRGLWVYLGAAVPRDAPYVVARADSGGTFTDLARVTAPADAKAAAARAARYARLLPGLPPADAAMVKRIVSYLSSHDDVSHLAEPNVALAYLIAGTAYLDTTAAAGHAYRYRISRGKTSVTTAQADFPGPAATLAVGEAVRADARGGAAMVTWRLPPGVSPGGLIVRRRAARKGDFTPCRAVAGFYAENDTNFATVSDKTVEPNALYQYTATLVDRFANPGPTSRPVAVTTFASGGVPLVVAFAAKDLGGHRVRLTWKLDGGGYSAGVTLYRSDSFDGPFARLISLPPGTQKYVDTVPIANENSYYRIGVDGATKGTMSATVAAMAIRAAPPLPPQNLRAERAEGGVRLRWDGLGPDIIGYQVYRQGGAQKRMQQVSGLVPADSTAATWVDTTAGLSGRSAFGYVVRAVGDAYGLSEPSNTTTIVPAPDYVLRTPTGLRAVVRADTVMLFWDDLSAREPTLSGYDVFRRPAGKGKFAAVHRSGFAPQTNHWTDAGGAAGAAYEYAVQAVDLNGLKSHLSSPLAVRLAASLGLPAPSSLRTAAVAGGLALFWGQVYAPHVAGYRIYRHTAGGRTTLVKKTSPDALSWTDTHARARTVYIYQVAAVDSTGAEGPASAPVTGRRP